MTIHATLRPGTVCDPSYLRYERDAFHRIRDVHITNHYGRPTVPLPVLVGPDSRAVYVYWDSQLIEIAMNDDGTYRPVTEIVLLEEA